MHPRFNKLVTGGIAAAVLTAAIGGAAFAQTPSATPVPPQQRAQELVDSFAGKIGKTSAEVLAAVVAVQKERVAADLAAGRITQEQANQANQRIDQAGGLSFLGGPRGGHGPGGHGPAKHVRIGGAELATFLGVQPAELMTALQSGKTLAAFAQEKGKSRDDLKSFLTTQERTKLAQAVTAGRLTQAQADERLAQLTSGLDALIDRTGPPAGGPGVRDGRGGPRGGARGFGPGAAPGGASAPSTAPAVRA
jgi:hypothetical protein